MLCLSIHFNYNTLVKNGLFIAIFFFFHSAMYCQTTADTSKLVQAHYGSKGFELQTKDKRFLFQIQSRMQFRFATPGDQDPVTFDDYQQGKHTTFKINRARLKIGGHAFQPWLKYYWEYELSQSNLLDFRVMLEKWTWLSLKVG